MRRLMSLIFVFVAGCASATGDGVLGDSWFGDFRSLFGSGDSSRPSSPPQLSSPSSLPPSQRSPSGAGDGSWLP
jgi:hypothetical protein